VSLATSCAGAHEFLSYHSFFWQVRIRITVRVRVRVRVWVRVRVRVSLSKPHSIFWQDAQSHYRTAGAVLQRMSPSQADIGRYREI